MSNADTGRIFSRFAGMHRWRHRLLGLERTQRQLVAGLRRAGIVDASLLEVGCGAGELQRALLRAGASQATGVDLSAGMLAIARAEAAASGMSNRTEYRQGDFTAMAEELPDADAVVLDKVVCCYPDWERMLDRSLGKARRLYALTYPRDRGLTRLVLRAMRWGLHRAGCCYQPYLHDPERIAARIREHGFHRVDAALTPVWLTEVYARARDSR
jgi:magnesium-protoporphyrin O-methyltransferase